LQDAATLIIAGTNPNIQNNDGETALMWAAGLGYIDIVKLLLNKGADINIKDNDGNTALNIAESKGYIDIAQLIREKTNQKNNFCLVS